MRVKSRFALAIPTPLHRHPIGIRNRPDQVAHGRGPLRVRVQMAEMTDERPLHRHQSGRLLQLEPRLVRVRRVQVSLERVHDDIGHGHTALRLHRLVVLVQLRVGPYIRPEVANVLLLHQDLAIFLIPPVDLFPQIIDLCGVVVGRVDWLLPFSASGFTFNDGRCTATAAILTLDGSLLLGWNSHANRGAGGGFLQIRDEEWRWESVGESAWRDHSWCWK